MRRDNALGSECGGQEWHKQERAVPVSGRYSFTTFEEYVEQRWDWSKSAAYNLIEAADVASKMSTIVDVLPSRYLVGTRSRRSRSTLSSDGTSTAMVHTGLFSMRKRRRNCRKFPTNYLLANRTSASYVEQRWDMSDRTARQLIESADAAEKLRQLSEILPSKESHVRELLKLEQDDERATVWQSVVVEG
jgi:hypothetical protein